MENFQQFESMKQNEIKLLQQVYEQKIQYLEAKIEFLQKSQSPKPKEQSLEVDTTQQMKSQLISMTIEKEKELQKMRQQHSQEIQNLESMLKNKDKLIEHLQSEVDAFKQVSLKQMDEQKIQYLSQIIDLTNEIARI